MVWGGTVEGEWNIVIGTRRFNRSITRERGVRWRKMGIKLNYLKDNQQEHTQHDPNGDLSFN